MSRKVIYRLSVGDNKLSKWTVQDGPLSLSVTSSEHLLVTCPASGKLMEFTTDGRLVREIILDQNFSTTPEQVRKLVNVKIFKACRAIAELLCVTCHMRSRSVTCQCCYTCQAWWTRRALSRVQYRAT